MEMNIPKLCMGYIDLTTLSVTDTEQKVVSMAEKVNQYPKLYPNYPTVAAICVYPNFVRTLKTELQSDKVKIAAVGGGFPASQTFIDIKKDECRRAVADGADEIDIVLSLNYFLSKNYNAASAEIKEIKTAIGKAHLKVIIESGELGSAENIYKASILSMEAGADFIKTSTGKTPISATPEAAKEMCRAIKDFYLSSGHKVGFKASGGIVSTDDATLYFNIVREILGEEWLTPTLFRFGASRLANNLLSSLESKTISYF